MSNVSNAPVAWKRVSHRDFSVIGAFTWLLALPLPRLNGMRTIRRFSQVILTTFGGAMVFWAVYRVVELRERVLLVSLGLVLMELGIWQVTGFFFPNQREFRPLRKETDYFLKLVRRLNRAAVAAQRGSTNAFVEIDRVEEEMHHSVERMRRLAGQSEEPAAAPVRTVVATPR